MKIKLSQAEISEIEQILKPAIKMNFNKGQSVIYPYGNREKARERLNEIAVAKRAPRLEKDQYYGLREDGFIVGLDGELIEETKAQEQNALS